MHLLSAHGEYQTFKYNKKNEISYLEKTSTHESVNGVVKRAKIFSAVNSHALYARHGTYLRIGGFGNDNCASGLELDPKVEFLEKTDKLMTWGTSGRAGVGTEGVGAPSKLFKTQSYKTVKFTRIQTFWANSFFIFVWTGTAVAFAIFVVYLFKKFNMDIRPTNYLEWARLFALSAYALLVNLKVILTIAGPRFDLEVTPESILSWVLPFRWH